MQNIPCWFTVLVDRITQLALKQKLPVRDCGEGYPSKIKLGQRARTTNILLAIQELHNNTTKMEFLVRDGLSSILWNPLAAFVAGVTRSREQCHVS